MLPTSPQLNAQVENYTLTNNVLTLHCSYTANWNFPLSNLEVQGSVGSEDFTIANVTYTTFDIVIDSSEYSNAQTNTGGTLMVTTTVWGEWQEITSTIVINANVTSSSGTINISASNGTELTIKTTS